MSKVNPDSQTDMPATVNTITSPSEIFGLEIINPDGQKDIIIANRTGIQITILLPDSIQIETDALFAFAGLNDKAGFISRGTYLKVNGEIMSLQGTPDTFMSTIP